MTENVILAALRERAQAADHHALSTGPPGQEPVRPRPKFRGTRKKEPNLVITQVDTLDVDAARRVISTAQQEYRTMTPLHMLLIAAPPGVGKTSIAVKLAEDEAAAGKRVLFLGPRHDLFLDILKMARHPTWWFEWLPRQEGNDATGKLETCLYTEPMNKWVRRGYDAIDFCANGKICGWGYINDGCPYHAQKRTLAPIVFGQHFHLTLGHPLLETFDMIIGDENPIGAFKHHWHFESRFIVPPDMDPTKPMTELLHELRDACDREVQAEGPDLLNILGGAARVREICDGYALPVDAAVLAPNLRSAAGVDDLPYFHLPQLANLLLRESRAAEAGEPYPPRVYIAKKRLHLLLRYQVNDRATTKIIWLDGTANQRLYEAMFQRPVEVVAPQVALKGKVFQVWSRTNGKGSLVNDQGPTGKFDQLQQQIRRIIAKYGYKRPAIMTHKALAERFSEYQHVGHFGATRGSNEFVDCDALIVAGTPQPPLDEMHAEARMLFFDRTKAFTQTWSERDVPYAYDAGGYGWSYPVSNFYDDPDLAAVLWQRREAEIVQAAHRVRPVLQDVDIWLLTNIPIEQLPPSELLSIQDLFGAPDGVDVYRWLEVLDIADAFFDADTPLRSVDLVERLEISPTTARHYLDCIEKEQVGRWKAEKVLVPNKQGKVGRPAQALVPLYT
jgi:hypothetical protein